MQIPLIAIELVLGFVAPIAWGVWELIALRRERERGRVDAQALREGAVGESSATDEVARRR